VTKTTFLQDSRFYNFCEIILDVSRHLVGDAEDLANADEGGIADVVRVHQLLLGNTEAHSNTVEVITGNDGVGGLAIIISRGLRSRSRSRLGSRSRSRAAEALVGQGVQTTSVIETIGSSVDLSGGTKEILVIREGVQIVPLPEETTGLCEERKMTALENKR
jgi:DNA/RNA endonuclease YhcR with UshA esterase domain